MGTLKDMLNFLEETRVQIRVIHDRLDELQKYFNDNFINVNKIRNSEIKFLQKSFFEDSTQFPHEISDFYRKEISEQQKKYAANIQKLKSGQGQLKAKFKKIDSMRINYFKLKKEANGKLDKKEENLKKRVVGFEYKIRDFNKNIDELNSGFGFFINLFKMRKIQARKDALIEERDELVDKIEEIRNKWLKENKDFILQEDELLNSWNDIQVDYALISDKLENLENNREGIIQKAAFMGALDNLKGDERYIIEKIKIKQYNECPRCKSANTDNTFFCDFCGERFSDDRPDIMGSLIEAGELNEVFDKLQNGMKESVSLLALMKGVKNGIETFKESVAKVKASQDKYASLPALKIDVPKYSQDFAENIIKIKESLDVKYLNLHPQEFALSIKKQTEKVLDAAQIEGFFTRMGDELNRTTKGQWK